MSDTNDGGELQAIDNSAEPESDDAGPDFGAMLERVGTTLRQSDIMLALVVVGILIALIMPMPRWLMDFSLAISITFSVLVLMVGLFIARPLDFSAFPTVLLIATMLRLALNLASTRLILADGHTGTQAAGKVIQAFGDFVMSGNFVIGIIVFAILVIVNFVVITKGSSRIAEVAARFSLDAMPGKQMAIDADLSSGLIDEGEARRRRRELEDESTFFGAMDGAAKFVRGDAIAGLLITFINVIGGMVIGVAQHGMSFGDAANNYTLLTVGDGLVTQIPALIVSTAAGLLVSKAGVRGSADKAVFGQLGAYPKALGMVSGLMVALSLLPGIPMVPFLFLAGLAGFSAWRLSDQARQRSAESEAVAKAQAEASMAAPAEEPIATALHIDVLRLEMGYGLLPLINDQKSHRLTDQIKALRRQLATELGFVMPAVRIQDNMQLPANQYVIRVKDIEAGTGELIPTQLLVMDPRGEPIGLSGQETVEPTFGLPAKWIPESQREEALFRGLTVVEPASPAELRAAVARQSDDAVTLIDTTGANPFHASEMAALAQLIEAADAEPVLVLAAGGDVAEAAEIVGSFAAIGARRMVVTRLDISRRLGAMLVVAEAGPLAFSDVSFSPQVARGLKFLTPQALARLLMRDPLQAAQHDATPKKALIR